MSSVRWVMLCHTIPRTPSAPRVAVWRKLKKLGAHCLLEGPWVLPETKSTTEQLRWLSAEIDELGGQAYLWVATSLGEDQDSVLTQAFRSEASQKYLEVMSELTNGLPLPEGAARYRQIRKTDYFAVPEGELLLRVLQGETT